MICDHPIPVEKLLTGMQQDAGGAMVLFLGTVRNNNQGKEVLCLEYEAFEPLADRMIEKIVGEAKKKFQLLEALCVHRVGRLVIGEAAVLVITVSKHRREAYAANQYIIDHVKHEVPIWKKEHYLNGTYEWGHNCDCPLPHRDLEEYLLHHPSNR